MDWIQVITFIASVAGMLSSLAGIIYWWRQELKEDINRLEQKLESDIQRQDRQIARMDANFHQQQARIDQQNARTDTLHQMFYDLLNSQTSKK